MIRNLFFALGLALLGAGVSVPAAADEVVLVSSHTRDFIGADAPGGVLKGVPLREQALVLERITLDGNRMAFRAADGRFLRAGVGAQTYLSAVSPHIRGWETFEIVRVSASKFAIRSVQNGRYVRLGADGRLAAVSEAVGSRETFSSRPAENAAAEPLPELEPEAERAALAGSWRVHRVRTFDGSLVPVPAALRDDALVRIRANGRLTASVGCNDISARVRAAEELVEFGQVMTTKKLCFDDAGAYELLLHIAFDHSRRYDAMGNQLRFFDVNGDPVMVLRPN
jgi:heat shock protein HslJ